jgi:hypothetical protein
MLTCPPPYVHLSALLAVDNARFISGTFTQRKQRWVIAGIRDHPSAGEITGPRAGKQFGRRYFYPYLVPFAIMGVLAGGLI